MPRWLLSSPTEVAPGGRLVAFGIGTVVAVIWGNWTPPGSGWVWVLAVAAAAAAGCGLRCDRPRLGWWLSAGVMAGLAACAGAARVAEAGVEGGVPVRFEATVCDGWRAGAFGWQNRFSLDSVEHAGQRRRAAREVPAMIGGDVAQSELPPPGARIFGAGVLLGDPDAPLAPPRLAIKTLLLVERVVPGRGVDRWRDAGVTALERAAGVDSRRLNAAGLAAALVLGRTEGILDSDRESLRGSGLAHILSVSGLHVGVVAVLIWGAGALLGIRPRTRRWVLIAALIVFSLFAGGWAPVRRAAAAGVAYALSRQFGRPLEPLPTVWAVVAGLLLWEPWALLQAGFQLSALVTLALVRWVKPLIARGKILPAWFAVALAVALVAQVASAPLIGQHFVVVPPLSILANLVAAPLALPLVLTSILAMVAAPVVPLAGGWLLDALAAGQGLLRLASDLGDWLAWPFPPAPALLIAAGVAIALIALTRLRVAVPAAVAWAIGSVVWALAPAGRPTAAAELRMLPVREGMAVLIQTPAGAVLVDSGRARLDALRALAARRVRRLDVLVLTHADTDHTGGAVSVLRAIPVGRLIVPAAVSDAEPLVEARREAWRQGVAVDLVAVGDRVTCAGIDARVLWPPPVEPRHDNDASIVLRCAIGGVRLLITGDLETAGERELLATGADVRSDILQLGHHGSAGSSSAKFLSAVRPRLAFAATGEEPRFRFPAPATVARARAGRSVVIAERDGWSALTWQDRSGIALNGRCPVVIRLAGAGR